MGAQAHSKPHSEALPIIASEQTDARPLTQTPPTPPRRSPATNCRPSRQITAPRPLFARFPRRYVAYHATLRNRPRRYVAYHATLRNRPSRQITAPRHSSQPRTPLHRVPRPLFATAHAVATCPAVKRASAHVVAICRRQCGGPKTGCPEPNIEVRIRTSSRSRSAHFTLPPASAPTRAGRHSAPPKKNALFCVVARAEEERREETLAR